MSDQPEIIDASAIADDERAVIRRGSVDVDSLDREVKQMRAAVESMGGDVGELRDGIDRLEPHLEDVSKVAHPLRRLNDSRRRRDSGA